MTSSTQEIAAVRQKRVDSEMETASDGEEEANRERETATDKEEEADKVIKKQEQKLYIIVKNVFCYCKVVLLVCQIMTPFLACL